MVVKRKGLVVGGNVCGSWGSVSVSVNVVAVGIKRRDGGSDDRPGWTSHGFPVDVEIVID